MLIAMGVVGAIRGCSYYKEALATDIFKILPFALLGIMIIDASLVNIVDTAAGVREAALLWETLVFYLVTVVLVEFVLRMMTGLFGLIRKGKRAEEQQERNGAQPLREAPVAAQQGISRELPDQAWAPSQPQPAYVNHVGGVQPAAQNERAWNGRESLGPNGSGRPFPKGHHQSVQDSRTS